LFARGFEVFGDIMRENVGIGNGSGFFTIGRLNPEAVRVEEEPYSVAFTRLFPTF
jgi:hypothetical protein